MGPCAVNAFWSDRPDLGLYKFLQFPLAQFLPLKWDSQDAPANLKLHVSSSPSRNHVVKTQPKIIETGSPYFASI